MRRFTASSVFATLLVTLGLASSAQADPEMFNASFIFHAWGNDVSSGNPTTAPTQYTENHWSAVPLGYDCQHAEPFTANGGPSSRYCTVGIIHKGHPATGMWTRSIGTGTPPRITLQQSDFGIKLYTLPLGADTMTPHCCRGFSVTFPPYLQSFTYATFVNAAGSFFAGGGAAAVLGYNNKLPGSAMTAGSWLVRAGKNAFGGAMGLLGKYGATGKFSVAAQGGATYHGVSSWNMVKAIGRPLFNTTIGATPDGAPLYQNPYIKTDMWYRTPTMGPVKISTLTAIGSATLWTTGQVGGFAKTGAYFSSFWRTGYDNRTPGGAGNIQLVTPTLTHWLSPGFNTHTAQIGILKIQVPEPSAALLLAAGGGALGLLYWVSRRVR